MFFTLERAVEGIRGHRYLGRHKGLNGRGRNRGQFGVAFAGKGKLPYILRVLPSKSSAGSAWNGGGEWLPLRCGGGQGSAAWEIERDVLRSYVFSPQVSFKYYSRSHGSMLI